MIVTAENITDLIGCEFNSMDTTKRYKIIKAEYIISQLYQIEILDMTYSNNFMLSVDTVVYNLNSDRYILDETFLRKKKLKQIMNEFKGKI